MEGIEQKRPPGFMIFEESAKLLLNSKDAAAGRIIKAMCNLYLTGEYKTLTNPLENVMFEEIATKAGRSMAEYQRKSAQGTAAANIRWHGNPEGKKEG